MTRVASHRLADATAALEPADRALLSLLINHGLDDETLGRMMQATPTAIASRRQQLVERLGATLGLPPDSVLAALQELAVSLRGQAQADGHPPAVAETPVAEPHVAQPVPGNGGAPALAAAGQAAGPQAEPSLSRARRRLLVGPVLLLAVAVVLIVVLSSGKAKRTPTVVAVGHVTAPGTATAPTASAPNATVPSTTVTAPATATPPVGAAGSAHRAVLATLPGGPAGVRGSATILRSGARRRLALSASGLPAPGRRHYELWLYNSVIDSLPLGVLRAPSDSLTVVLPARYHHYRWLDVSLQPPRSVNHSGESILRTPLPR